LQLGRTIVALLGALALAHLGGCSNGPDGPLEGGAVQATESIEGGSVQTAFSRSMDMPQGPAEGGRKVIESPTLADLMVAGPLPERILGKADAPVTVIEYASLTCPYCRAFHDKTFPRVKKDLIATGRLRWILREFPIGRSSGTAWIVTRCAPEKRYFSLYERFLKEQPSWVSQEVRTDAIFAVAQKEGMTRSEFDKCLSNQDIESGLKWVKERGRELGVVGTPTFFINERKVGTILSYEELKALIDQAPAGAPQAAASASN
jgi:protein-disulfide isomerase